MRQTEPRLRNELMTSCDNTKTFKTKLETLRPIPSPYNLPLERSDLFTDQCLTTSTHFFLYQDSPKMAGYAYIQLKKRSHAIAATMQSPRYAHCCQLPSQQLYLDAN